ncbi:DUF3027 domain-containing protein [Corynebacterium sp. 4HC-13]|nr:DUF3027 domain-containing protein [Corynebacterium anserum]
MPETLGIIGNVSRRKTSNTKVDPLLFSDEAKELARQALVEIGDDLVGEHIGVSISGEVAVHRFRSLAPGYKNWEWVAVLACVRGSGAITVNEVSLQAGKNAARAPEWIPYEDRVLPGDLGPGDTLPPRADDDRLCQFKELTTAHNFPRNPRARTILSQMGLEQTLKRWRTGEFGPNSEFAAKAAMMCRTCAFYLPFNDVETHFGVCTNEYSADGHVVHETYGCGAHSETKAVPETQTNRHYGAFDDGAFDDISEEICRDR